LQLAPGDSTIEDSTGEDHVDRKMTIPKGKTRYQFMSFIHEILFLFISSFLSFPSHIKRIILCFVYSDDNRPSFIYPSLEEENMPSSCVVDTDLVSSPLPIHKSEICIASPLEIDHPCSPEEVENSSQSSQISLPSVIPVEPCHQLVNPHDQPTAFQIKIRNKLFKPLRLPHDLHPYPRYSFEYLPRFSGEDHITAERHLEAFESFVDQFEIVHDDVAMRLFSQSLSGDVVVWFRCLEVGSIGSWTELCHAFLKCWGENKSLDQYWFEFNALRRGEEEALVVFNRRFYSVYHSMPMEIRPTETVSMVYYVMAQHPELVLLLRERKSSSLRHLFEDVEEVEENIRASKGVHVQAYLENLHVHKQEDCQYVSDSEQEDCQYVSDSEHEDIEYESDLEQQQGSSEDNEGKRFSLVPIYDDYESDPWESHEEEMEELNVQSTSCPEPVNEQIPTLHFVDLGRSKPAYDSYESDSDMDMKYFQDHTIEPFPLFIEERHWVEINHPGPAEDTEQHEKEELNVWFISCPEPVNEQISPGIGRPASVLHPPVHSESIKQRVRNNEEQEVISYQLSSPDCKFCDPVGSYMELCFQKTLETAELFIFSSFGGMGNIPSHVLILLSYLPRFLRISCSKDKKFITGQSGWLWWKFSFT
jgi:hypothetical protein